MLPEGWQDRLVRFQTAGTRGVTAWCLEPHDLWISKIVAWRPEDLECGRTLLERRIVRPAELMERLEDMDVPDPIRRRIAGKIGAWSTG